MCYPLPGCLVSLIGPLVSVLVGLETAADESSQYLRAVGQEVGQLVSGFLDAPQMDSHQESVSYPLLQFIASSSPPSSWLP